jgi:hypothetical protein
MGAGAGRALYQALREAAGRGVTIRILQSPGFSHQRQESDSLREEFPDRISIRSVEMDKWYGGSCCTGRDYEAPVNCRNGPADLRSAAREKQEGNRCGTRYDRLHHGKPGTRDCAPGPGVQVVIARSAMARTSCCLMLI